MRRSATARAARAAPRRSPPLVGGAPLTNGIDAQKTIANYYAYATTMFDYVRRAMPYNAPRSLTDDEVYALTAYILTSTSSSARTTRWTPRPCRR